MTVTLASLQGLVPALGWTLAHFLWQGALVAFALQVALKASHTSRTRHDVALAALTLMAILPVVTFAWLQSGVQIVLVPKDFPGLTPPSDRWETFAVAAWLAGVMVLLVRLAGGLVLVERLRRSAKALPAEWAARCLVLEQQLAAPLKVAFAQSHAVATPIVAGWLKPMVLVPASFLVRLPAAELEALILHELAHVRRLDAFANLIQSVVETVLFYHPAVWWVSRQVRQEREQCCDEMAAAAIADPALYVRALQSLEALRAPSFGVLAANGDGDLTRRAAHILGLAMSPKRPALSRSAAVAILAFAAAAMTHSAVVQAEPTSPAPAISPPGGVAEARAASSAPVDPKLSPVAERRLPAPEPDLAPRIVLAAADVAGPVPTAFVQVLAPAATAAPATAATAAAPTPAPRQVASISEREVEDTSNGTTLTPLVVSAGKPRQPDVRIDAGALNQRWALWPQDALSQGFDGHVVLTCYIDAHGLAESCAVDQESPANKHFGYAALQMRSSLRVRPAQGVDGPMDSLMTIAVDFNRSDIHATDRAVRGVCGNTAQDGSGAMACTTAAPSIGDRARVGGGAGENPVTMLDFPVWAQAASFDDLAAAYPKGGHGAEGFVVDHCAVRRDGKLEGCEVTREEPAGRGFARAALALSHKFQVAPELATDPRAGRSLWVDVPIRFPAPRELAERTVDAPSWIVGSNRGLGLAVYPKAALAAARQTARCVVGADGTLSGCVAEGDGRSDPGLSAAAAKLATTLKVNLWSADGAPVEGGVVRIPMKLNENGG